MHRLWLLFAALAACDAGASDPFWDESALDGDKRVAVHPGPTDRAELVETLPVGRSEDGATRRVVLRLSPGQLPGLALGDRLITPAEVQVTTRCDIGQSAPGCGYNPNVRAQLILTGDPGDTSPAGGRSKALSEIQTQVCTSAEHHCRFVFRPSDASQDLASGFDLPCLATDSCHVNLVMWAWHGDARAGGDDKVLVGSNDGDYLANGRVEQDQARLMVIRERGLDGADRVTRETGGGGGQSINTRAEPELVYSHALKGGADLAAGEQYEIEAKLVTAVDARARFSTEIFLTKDPDARDGDGLDKVTPQAIGEHNGVNCTPGTSPCTTHRVAVLRVTEDIVGPVYVNVVGKSAVPGGGSAQVTVRRDDGWVRSVRYRAALGQ
ncbi:MAG TPA: hypothetical protein VNO30_08870 [Kofleriaceae bacterium]|nr:hypothetical protein [Kofleriaceae bacterium]